jgi:hypothetical protein
LLSSVMKSSLGALLRGSMAGDGGGGRPQARFVGDPYVEGDGDDSVTVTIRRATIGTTYLLTISSSGGGTDVTDTDTVATEDFDITALDLTGLSPGALTLSYEEDSVEVSTDTALLLPPFDVLLADDGVTPLLADDNVTELTADA